MKKMFMSLSIIISFFLSSFTFAQNNQLQCKETIKYYPVYLACVVGVNSRPLFYTIEISTLMTPYTCSPVSYSRDASITVKDHSGV
jgi:putative flippase GtrA